MKLKDCSRQNETGKKNLWSQFPENFLATFWLNLLGCPCGSFSKVMGQNFHHFKALLDPFNPKLTKTASNGIKIVKNRLMGGVFGRFCYPGM